MNYKIQNYLAGAAIFMMAAFAISALSYVNSYSRSIEPSSFRSFSVSAEGKVNAIPDVASFSFSVITEGGKDVANIQKENSDKINKITDFIKGKEVKTQDIKTEIYNLEPRYKYCRLDKGEECYPPEIIGYKLTQTVSIKIRDFSKIGELLKGVVENGANSVSNLSFVVDDPIAVQNKARAEAIAKAREKAKLIAKEGKFRIGRILSISEDGGFYPIYRSELGGFAESLPFKSAPPTIEPGSEEITVRINLTYEIQ